MSNPYPLVHPEAGLSRKRLAELANSDSEYAIALAKAHRLALEEITQKYVPGVDDDNPAKLHAFLTRVEAVLSFIEREIPLQLPLKSSSPITGDASVIGEFNPLFHELAYQRMTQDTAPAIQDALAVLMTAYAAHGYLSGVPRTGELASNTGLSHALASGQIPLVDPRYLEEAISAGNAYFAAAFVTAGADWTKVPLRDVTVRERGGSAGEVRTISSGDWAKLIAHCLKPPAEAAHLHQVIATQTRRRIALGMGLAMAAGRMQTRSEEAARPAALRRRGL